VFGWWWENDQDDNPTKAIDSLEEQKAAVEAAALAGGVRPTLGGPSGGAEEGVRPRAAAHG